VDSILRQVPLAIDLLMNILHQYKKVGVWLNIAAPFAAILNMEDNAL
jgi:hypothetical protein